MFGKKKSEEESEEAEEESEEVEEKKSAAIETGNPKLDMQLVRMGAQIEGFGETRKSNSERFSRVSEQIGELRGMIMDVNKAMGGIDVKATRASDLVSSVQPEKLMIDVRKTEGKVEGLKANVDSNEAIMKDIMKSLKGVRQQMNFYKGIDQVIKLNEDVKNELMEIKKIEANTKRNADRIDTIYLEFTKKFSTFETYDNTVKDLNMRLRKLEGDFDKMKVTQDLKGDKKEINKLVDKFSEFEKHTTNMMNLLDTRSKQAKDTLVGDYKNMQEKIAKKYDVDLAKKEEHKKIGFGDLLGKLKLKKDAPAEGKEGEKEEAKPAEGEAAPAEEKKEEPAEKTEAPKEEAKPTESATPAATPAKPAAESAKPAPAPAPAPPA